MSKKFLPPAWRIRFGIPSTPGLLSGGSRSRIGLTSASVTGWVHGGGGVVGWLSSFTSCSTLSASGSSNGDRWWFLRWWPSANRNWLHALAACEAVLAGSSERSHVAGSVLSFLLKYMNAGRWTERLRTLDAVCWKYCQASLIIKY